METTTITTTTTTITTSTTRAEEEEQPTTTSSKVYMMNDQKDLFQLLVILFIDFLYRIFILTPISIIKSYSRHPLYITFLFSFLFPIYLFLQFIISFIAFVSRFITSKQQAGFIKSFFGNSSDGSGSALGDAFISHHNVTQPNNTRVHRRVDEGGQDDEDDDMQQWLERCSICFDSKLDLCLDYCRDQFCLDCFQKYVSEVVKSSWGLCVTKIRCPVCRVYIPQSEWTKFVPTSIVELYNKFNRPYRSFSRSCPHCENEVIPCDFNIPSHASSSFAASFYGGRGGSSGEVSKTISSLVQQYFTTANSHCTLEQRLDHILPPLSYQQHVVKLFAKSEWRNSTLPDIHHQLITKLIKANVTIDQMGLVKRISKEVLQLDMRPDTWRRLQFDHISFFSNIDCPHCEKPFCLKCGHNDTHGDLTCLENMKRLVVSAVETNNDATADNDSIQTLKWKLENSRNCPICSIMINRDEGCNKVDCTLCGFSFCWECKSTWSDGCGFFNCLVKSEMAAAEKVDKPQEDEGSVYSPAMFEQGGAATSGNGDASNNINRTELGVPDIDIIHSRLNNSSSQ